MQRQSARVTLGSGAVPTRLSFQRPSSRAFKMATRVTASGQNGTSNGSSRHLGVLRFPRRQTFKTILSVDGGGLRGLIPATLLEGAEDAIRAVAIAYELTGIDASGKEVKVRPGSEFSLQPADYFDICAGTSTGAIIATYVASKGSQAGAMHSSASFVAGTKQAAVIKAQVRGDPGTKPTDVPPAPGSAEAAQALFLASSPSIFPLRSWRDKVGAFFGPKYPASYTGEDGKEAGIEAVLKSAFGANTKMADEGVLSSSLVVASYQLDFDRPFLFFYSSKDGRADGKGVSGFGALRRTLTADQERRADTEHRGQSDLVRVEQPFKLWQTVRASTAAPTFFPTAAVDNLGSADPQLKTYQMTDGGVVANNPAMVATTFAAGKYETAFVGEKGKPSLAVLSLGCGGTSQLSKVKQNAGVIDWVVKGPLVDILGSGAGELNAAISQQLAREWPGRKKYQFLRLQLTAGLDTKGDETLSYSKDLVRLPKNGEIDDEHAAPFKRALFSTASNNYLSANQVLKSMDVVAQKDQLLGLGYAVAQDEHVQKRLQHWVKTFVLDVPVTEEETMPHKQKESANKW